MRLRLKVQRHRLPDVSVIWVAKENENGQNSTIASLISDVNSSIPLESLTWALDDYVVEVGGFECLHYDITSHVLRDGDEVAIRPLLTPEIKKRRLGGRTQITADGFHLLDGVPFGLGSTQRPPRPGILIPSRKRRLADFEEEEDGEREVTVADIEEDEDELADTNSGQMDLEDLAGSAAGRGDRPTKKRKVGNVRFNLVDHIEGFEVEEDDDDDDDGDFNGSESGQDSEADPEDSEDESNESESSSAVSSASSSSGEEDDGSGTQPSTVPDTNSVSTNNNQLKTNGSFPKADDESRDNGKSNRTGDRTVTDGTDKEEWPNGFTHQPNHRVAPGTGLPETRERNRRRRDQKKLGHLIRTGHLPLGAKINDYFQWKREHPRGLRGLDERDTQEIMSQLTDSREKMYSAVSICLDDNNTTEDKDKDGKMDRDLLDAVRKDCPSTTEDEAPDVESTRQKNILKTLTLPSAELDHMVQSPQPETSTGKLTDVQQANSLDTKRARIDLNSSRRVIFGALGQRTPKTSADAERVKAKLAAFGKPKAKEKPAEAEPSDDEDIYSQKWKSKIKLMAIECTDPEQKLSEPPFPFVQRWDPSQQLKRKNNWWNEQGKGRKRKQRKSYGYNDDNWEGYDEEAYGEWNDDEYDDNGQEFDGNACEYNELDGYSDNRIASFDNSGVDIDRHTSTYYDGDAKKSDSAEDQLLTEAAYTTPDLPSLPSDISLLPALEQGELIPGVIIAFKHLECDESTSWQPVMSPYRTAKVLNVDEKGVAEVELAQRDRVVKEKRYDSAGRRLYDKFDMNAGSDEDLDDDGYRDIKYTDMVEPKVLMAACESSGEIVKT